MSFTWETRRDSDHYSFFAQQIPYLMIFTGKHPDYHTPYDDVDKLNLDGMERITRLLFRIVYTAAQSAESSRRFAPAAFQEGAQAQLDAENAPPESPIRLGVTWDEAREAKAHRSHRNRRRFGRRVGRISGRRSCAANSTALASRAPMTCATPSLPPASRRRPSSSVQDRMSPRAVDGASARDRRIRSAALLPLRRCRTGNRASSAESPGSAARRGQDSRERPHRAGRPHDVSRRLPGVRALCCGPATARSRSRPSGTASRKFCGSCPDRTSGPQSSPIFSALADRARNLCGFAPAKTLAGRYKLPATLHFLKWHNPHRRYSCYDCRHRHSRQIRVRSVGGRRRFARTVRLPGIRAWLDDWRLALPLQRAS